MFEVLRKLLLDAHSHFYIFEQTWPTKKVVEIISYYKGFFVPTRSAHLDRLINKVSEICSNKPSAPSFYRILNMIGSNPNLSPDIDAHEIKKRLRIHKKALVEMKYYRDKRAAHWDTSVENEAVGKPLLMDTKLMLKELETIFNKISSSHSKSVWSFRYTQQKDINSLLDALKEKRAQNKQLIEYWKNQL